MRSMCTKTCCVLGEPDAILGHVAWRGDRYPLQRFSIKTGKVVNNPVGVPRLEPGGSNTSIVDHQPARFLLAAFAAFLALGFRRCDHHRPIGAAALGAFRAGD